MAWMEENGKHTYERNASGNACNTGTATSVDVTEWLNEVKLRELRDWFTGSKQQSNCLGEHEFVAALLSVLQDVGVSDADCARLFKRVDSSATGAITWEQLTAYLVEGQAGSLGTSLESSSGRVASDTPVSIVSAPQQKHKAHRGGITSLSFFGDRVLSSGRDGYVRTWSRASMAHLRSVQASSSWVNAVVHMQVGEHSVIACATMARELKLLDASTLETVGSRRELNSALLSIDCWKSQTGKHERLLLTGDDSGTFTVYKLIDNERSKAAGSKPSSAGSMSGQIRKGNELRKQKSSSASYSLEPLLTKRLHSDWISRVFTLEGVQSAVSVGHDGRVQVIDLERMIHARQLHGHNKAVYSCAWSFAFRVLATAGQDRIIKLWNPYSGREVGSLEGLTAPVVCLATSEMDQHLISLSSDMTCKIFDIRSIGRCIHTCSVRNAQPHQSSSPEALLFDNNLEHVIVGFNSPASVLLAPELKAQHTHTTPSTALVAALYSSPLDMFIAVEEAADVRCYDSPTGKQRIKFRRTRKGQRNRIVNATCACLDPGQRRLIVGTVDGDAEMFNFSNGGLIMLLHAHTKQLGNELRTVITRIDTRGIMNVMGAGWSHEVLEWQPDVEDNNPTPCRRLVKHRADITTISSSPVMRAALASGDANGLCILWNLDSGVPRYSMRPAGIDEGEIDATGIMCESGNSSVDAVLYMNARENADLLITATSDAFLRIWSTKDASCVAEVQIERKAQNITSAVLTPDDALVCIADAFGGVTTVSLHNLPCVTGENVSKVSPYFMIVRSNVRVHSARIATVTTIQASELLSSVSQNLTSHETSNHLFLTSSADCTAKLITRHVELLGTIGSSTWSSNALARSISDSARDVSESKQSVDNASGLRVFLESGTTTMRESRAEPWAHSTVTTPTARPSCVSSIGRQLREDDAVMASELAATQRVELQMQMSRWNSRSATSLDNRVWQPTIRSLSALSAGGLTSTHGQRMAHRTETRQASMRLNHAHIHGRQASQVAHLLHVEDLTPSTRKPALSSPQRPHTALI